MNGPAHYKRAEQLADEAARGEVELARVQVVISLAQIHATLALAAATIDATFIADRLASSEAFTPAGVGADWTAATS